MPGFQIQSSMSDWEVRLRQTRSRCCVTLATPSSAALAIRYVSSTFLCCQTKRTEKPCPSCENMLPIWLHNKRRVTITVGSDCLTERGTYPGKSRTAVRLTFTMPSCLLIWNAPATRTDSLSLNVCAILARTSIALSLPEVVLSKEDPVNFPDFDIQCE